MILGVTATKHLSKQEKKKGRNEVLFSFEPFLFSDISALSG